MSDLKPLQELTQLLAEIRVAADPGAKSGGSKAPPKPPSLSSRARKTVRGAIDKGKEVAKAGNDFRKAADRIRKQQYDRRSALINAHGLQVVGTLNGNLRTIATRYKSLGKVVKAGMIAEATMKSLNAANDAYNRALALPKPFGLFAAPMAAGAALAIGAQSVAQISSQKFENGGPVERSMSAELEGGEYVVPRALVAELGGADGMEDAMEGEPAAERQIVPVVNVRVAGNADGGAIEGMRAQLRQGLAAIAAGM